MALYFPPVIISFSVCLFIFSFLHPYVCQVNIMVLTRVVVITISTAKKRSIMLAMGTSPAEQAYEQMRYKPQGGAISPPFLKFHSAERQALEQASYSRCMSNKTAAGNFYIGFVIFKMASLIYQTPENYRVNDLELDFLEKRCNLYHYVLVLQCR